MNDPRSNRKAIADSWGKVRSSYLSSLDVSKKYASESPKSPSLPDCFCHESTACLKKAYEQYFNQGREA